MEDMRRSKLSIECDLLTVQAELERLRTEKDAEERRKERCERDVAQLRGEVRMVTEANEAARGQIAELTVQRDTAKLEEVELLAKRKSYEALRQQTALHESEHEATQAQLAQLTDELERLRVLSDSERQLQKRRETELDEARRESELLLQSREQITSTLHKARHELRKLVEQKARDESELESDQLQLQRLQGEAASLRGTKLTVDSELETCRTEAARLRTEAADAEAALGAHRAQVDQLRRQLQLAQETSSDALGQLGGMRESLRSLALVQGKEKTGLRQDEDAVHQARAELHAIACQRDALSTQLQSLRSEVLMAEVRGRLAPQQQAGPARFGRRAACISGAQERGGVGARGAAARGRPIQGGARGAPLDQTAPRRQSRKPLPPVQLLFQAHSARSRIARTIPHTIAHVRPLLFSGAS
jgi:chromosome segregation ATPase